MASSLAAPEYSLNVSSFNTDESSEFEFDSGTFSELRDELPVSPKLINYSPDYVGASAFTMFTIDHTSALIAASLSAGEENVQSRANLASLLSRRDLGDLSPLTYDHHWNEYMRSVESSPASTGSSACSNYLADKSSPDQEISLAADEAETCVSPDSKSRHKRSRKWTFNLTFLKKGLSPGARDQPSLHQHIIRNKQRADYRSDRCSSSAATVIGSGMPGYNAQLANQSVVYMGADSAAQAFAMIDPETNCGPELPRRSSASLASSKSPPTSPAQSPAARLWPYAGEDGPITAGGRPLSPHAKHYEQQRARTEEQKRKTFLPYRQSLVSACFFPLPADHSQNLLEAVY